MIISNASLVFMGMLIITNIRGFAITAHKFLRIFFKSFLSQFISSEITLLITTQIIGVKVSLIADLLPLDLLPAAVESA